MSFWDREVKSPLDRLFDFNKDGKLDAFEETVMLDTIFSDEEAEEENGNYGDSEETDDYDEE